MRCRAFKIFLLAFQAIWLNAIVPGHTRGVVTLCGSASATATEVSAARTGCCPKKQSKDSQPTDQRASHCAVCHFAARVTPPPVFDLTLPALARTEIRIEVLPASADSADLPPVFYGRGPPTV